MDEISRELPPDTTTSSPNAERAKGPEELLRFERGQVDEHLVVRTRVVDAGGAAMPDAARAGAAEAPEMSGRRDAEGEREPDGDAEAAGAPPPPPQPEPDAAGDAIASDEVAVDAEAAARAVAAEAEVAEVEEVLAEDDDGLPPVPEASDPAAVARIVFVLMLSSRESLSLLRLAQACNCSQQLVGEALDLLQQQLRGLGMPVELLRVGDSVRWASAAEAFPYLQRLRGVKKLEKLSPAALETLAVIAYRQPVMRSEIEAIRGVKAGPMLRTLLQHKLVKVTGRADVPGRPLQYGTTHQFLERFGIASLQELPSIKEWKNLG